MIHGHLSFFVNEHFLSSQFIFQESPDQAVVLGTPEQELLNRCIGQTECPIWRAIMKNDKNVFELQDGTQVPLETVADIFEALHSDDPDGNY